MYRVRRVIGSWKAGPDTPGTDGQGTGSRLIRVATESEQGEHGIADITCDTATDRWTMRRLWG